MIGFYDFLPEVVVEATVLKAPVYEEISGPLRRANDWINQHNVNVVNVETVVLPNINHKREEGSLDTSLTTRGDYYSTWHQFIRVWYQYEEQAQ